MLLTRMHNILSLCLSLSLYIRFLHEMNDHNDITDVYTNEINTKYSISYLYLTLNCHFFHTGKKIGVTDHCVLSISVGRYAPGGYKNCYCFDHKLKCVDALNFASL